MRDMHKDSVTIEWNKPKDCGGLELIGYFVEKCDISKMVWTKVGDVDKDSTHLTIRRLQEDNQYMFRVFAQNSVGISEALESETVTIKSTIDYPGAPEGPLEVSGMTETSCTIKWNAPESDGGTPIIDYTVEQKESSKKAWQKVGVTKELYISISQMKMNTDYDFRITARNKVGTGPPYYSDEPITAGKRITPPSAPTDFAVADITSKSVTLKWGPPESSGGTELTGYIIEKQSMTSSKWTRVVTLDASVLQYTVENLKEKSEFYFRIYAENSIGLSTPASTGLVSLSTHATVPSPPTAPLEVRVIASHTIMIEWGVPETDGGAPLEGYKIAIRDMKKTMWMEVGQVRADVQKLSVKDLQEGHEYMIRIFARNEVGLSDPLETDEPFLVVRPTGMEEDMDMEEMGLDKDTPSISYSTENTTSWMREAGMDADIHTYARGSLLRRSEYFFRIWYYAKHLFR